MFDKFRLWKGMKKIILDLTGFIKSHFELKIYISFFLLNAVLIVFNYSLDFEDTYIDQYRYSWKHMFLLAAYLAVGYYLMVLIQQICKKDYRVLKSGAFWLKSSLALFLVGVDRAFYYHQSIIELIPLETVTFTYKCINNLLGAITIILPFIMIYIFYDKRHSIGFYGVKTRNVYLKPFFSLFIFIVPLVLLAAVFSEMGTYYPMYQSANATIFSDYLKMPEFIAVVIYEIAYAFDFFTVELVFRGFLIIGFIKLLGKGAILPMVTAYSILHFGKPLPETVSSIFGGYILGVFAYKYKHIWAGVILHIGLAWLMELFGWLF